MAHSTHAAQSLLERAHSPVAATLIFQEKVVNKPLYLRPTSPDPNSQDFRTKRRLQRLRNEEKTKRRRKSKPLSAKEKRTAGIYDVRDDAKKYEIYKPLHSMWLGYMREILGLEQSQNAFITAQNTGSILASADYHGAELTVVRSRCAGLVGLRGIVIRDTKFTFQLITKSDYLKSELSPKIKDPWILIACSYTEKVHCVSLPNSAELQNP